MTVSTCGYLAACPTSLVPESKNNTGEDTFGVLRICACVSGLLKLSCNIPDSIKVAKAGEKMIKKPRSGVSWATLSGGVSLEDTLQTPMGTRGVTCTYGNQARNVTSI
jgi:hypothetical protein